MLGGGRNPAVLSRRDGADDEGTRRVVEGDGQEDHMVVGGGNSGGNGSDDAPVAREIGDGRLCGAGGSPQGKAECPAHSAGNDREGAGALQGDVLRPVVLQTRKREYSGPLVLPNQAAAPEGV